MIDALSVLTRSNTTLMSGAVKLANDLLHRTANGYTDVDTQFFMDPINPRNDAGPSAYHKWATPDTKYQVRLCWFGGQAPFKVTLLAGPAGSTIGGSGNIQKMTRTADATVPGLFNHVLPNKTNVVEWMPQEADHGTTKAFKVLVEDNKGQQLIFRWSATVDRSRFTVIDSVNGLDINAGSWLAPKQTFNAAHVIANKIILAKDGTYLITSTALHDSANTARQVIGVGNNVIFDMTQNQFGCSGPCNDLAFINIKFTGSQNNGNNRLFNMGGKTNRPLWWNCSWANATAGTVKTDNPACVFFANLGGPATETELGRGWSHVDIAFVECSVAPTVEMQMAVTFSSLNVLFENCVGMYGTTTTYHNGAHFIHIKDQSCSVSVRFNYCEGITGDSAIQFANQSAWHCHRQECCYNVVDTGAEAAIRWNVQNTVAGNTAIGQTIGATRQFIYRNTFKCTNGWHQIPQYQAGSEPVTISNNLIITTGAGTTISPAAGYTLLGDNTTRAASYLDANKKIATAYRTLLAGKVGAEIASV